MQFELQQRSEISVSPSLCFQHEEDTSVSVRNAHQSDAGNVPFSKAIPLLPALDPTKLEHNLNSKYHDKDTIVHDRLPFQARLSPTLLRRQLPPSSMRACGTSRHKKGVEVEHEDAVKM